MVRPRADIFHHTPTGEVNQQGDDQTGAAQVVGYRIAELVGNHRRQRQRQQRTDIDRHIKQREGAIQAGIFWRIAFGQQACRVSFKQAVTHRNGPQRDENQIGFEQRQAGHKVACGKHNRAQNQRTFRTQQVIADIAADGDKAIYQRGKRAKGNKRLLLRKTELFNKENGQDPLNAVIAKSLP